jgi:undecaprenyl-diphosphatase
VNVLQAALLGLLQGLSEFLPISSSGHLILGSALLGLPAPGLSFSIMVHLGTAFATILMLWREIVWLVKGLFAPANREERGRASAVVAYLALASVPAAVLALLAGDFIERVFSSPIVASCGLIVTGVVLYMTRTPRRRRGRPASRSVDGVGSAGSSPETLRTVTLGRAVGIGVAQAVAIAPGVSRSGMTMASGLLLGMSREDAARFSFLLALPAVFGGALLDYLGTAEAGSSMFTSAGLTGAIVAFAAGVFALAVVFRVVRRGELSKFAFYCWAVGAASLAWFATRPR